MATKQFLRKMSSAGSLSKDKLKVLSVLYKAGDAAQNPRLLGCVENELGLREFLEERGHTYIVTDSKDGPGNELDKHLPDVDVLISTPFHPAFLTPERVKAAKKLKMALTAGIGSDHVDLPAAASAGITVAEITGSNVVSVAEHVVMMILSLVRNYMPAHAQVINGEWDVAKIAQNAYDVEGKIIGTVGAGRIGQRVLERLQAFNPKKLLYSDYAQLSSEREQQLKAQYTSLEDLVNPLHESTRGLFDEKLLRSMKKGAYLVNTARGAIVDRDSLVKVMNDGHLGGYAGDDSGTTLDAQARYASGVKEILRRTFEGEELNPTDVIVKGGKLAAQYDASSKDDRNLELKPEWEVNK